MNRFFTQIQWEVKDEIHSERDKYIIEYIPAFSEAETGGAHRTERK